MASACRSKELQRGVRRLIPYDPTASDEPTGREVHQLQHALLHIFRVKSPSSNITMASCVVLHYSVFFFASSLSPSCSKNFAAISKYSPTNTTPIASQEHTPRTCPNL